MTLRPILDAYDEIIDEPTGPRPPKTNRRLHPPPRFLTLTEFLGGFEPIRFQVDGVIRSGSLYTLSAKTGHGKTALMVTIAYAVATGRDDILKRKVERGRVAFISAENPDDLRMRLAVAADRLSVNVAEITEWITVLDRAASPEALLAELARLSETKPFAFIEIDTLAAMFDGRNVNDPQEAGEYMRRLRPLTRLPTSPTVLVAAHPTKNASPDQLIPLGAGATLNEVDGNLTLWKASGIASLHWQGKLRGKEFDPIPFKFEPWETKEIVDIYGTPVSVPVALPTTIEAVEERDRALGDAAMNLLRAMADDPKATQRELMVKTGLRGGSFSRTLDKLAKRKFISQRADDRWRVTPRGKKEIEGSE